MPVRWDDLVPVPATRERDPGLEAHLKDYPDPNEGAALKWDDLTPVTSASPTTPPSALSRAGQVVSDIGTSTTQRWQQSGQNLLDVLIGLLPGRSIPGATLGEKAQSVLGAVGTATGGGVFSPVGGTSEALSKAAGATPAQAKTYGDYAEMLTALGLPLFPTGPSTTARTLSRVGIGRPNAAARAVNAQEAMRTAFPVKGFPEIPLSAAETAAMQADDPYAFLGLKNLFNVPTGKPAKPDKVFKKLSNLQTIPEQVQATENAAARAQVGQLSRAVSPSVEELTDTERALLMEKLKQAGNLKGGIQAEGPDRSAITIATPPSSPPTWEQLTPVEQERVANLKGTYQPGQPSGPDTFPPRAVSPSPDVPPTSPVEERMRSLRNTIEDARSSIPTGKQFYRDQEGNIVKTGNAGSLFDKFKTLFPELENIPPKVTPGELVKAIGKDKGNKLYRLIQDEVKIQQAKEAANPATVSTRPSDYEQFAKYVDELAAQPEPVKSLTAPGQVKPPTATQPPLNEEPKNIVELGMGIPLPQSVKDWAQHSFPVKAGMKALEHSLPADLRVLREAPRSPVISLVDRVTNDVGAGVKSLVDKPWAKTLSRYTPEQMKNLEAKAVQIWQQGGKTADAYAEAVRAMPPEIQEMMRYRASRIPIEQQARQLLGLPKTDITAGPYFPRLAPRDLQDIVTIGRQGGVGLANDLRTTIGGFAKSRIYDTMMRGEADGITYADPRSAWALREWYSQTLEATTKMVKDMEGTVLFRSKADAIAHNPSGTPTRIEGIPGSVHWWTPTRAEADFLEQNLTKRSYGPSSSLSSLTNQAFRNPNLFNPYPHFIKNMLFKFGLSGGNFATFRGSMKELATQPNNPLVQRFKAAFPVESTSALPNELLRPYLRPEPNIVEQGLTAAQTLNRYSRERIFTEMDPGLRYARWKQYVQRGMDDTEAANHVHLDLVRYGLRSAAKDFWQSIPLNFFTAWRTGTVMSLVKQATSHPIRAALFVGAVEYLREARYRQTGRWTHIPTDYVEAPVAQIVEHPTPNTILPIVATTALFGPGGAVTASTLRDALDDVRGGGDWRRIQNMFWGLSQLYDMPKEWGAYRQTGNVGHLVNILTGAAIAEHSALNYEPRRFTKYLPESLPFLRKSLLVEDAEYMQAAQKARAERQRERQSMRLPRRTIEERLTNE